MVRIFRRFFGNVPFEGSRLNAGRGQLVTILWVEASPLARRFSRSTVSAMARPTLVPTKNAVSFLFMLVPSFLS